MDASSSNTNHTNHHHHHHHHHRTGGLPIARTYSGDSVSREHETTKKPNGVSGSVIRLEAPNHGGRRKSPKSAAAAAATAVPVVTANGSGISNGPKRISWVTVFLTAGLFFCCVDVLYIWIYVGQQQYSNDEQQQQQRSVHDVLFDPINTAQQQQQRRVVADNTQVKPLLRIPIVPAKDRSVETLPSDWIGTGQEPILHLLAEALGGQPNKHHHRGDSTTAAEAEAVTTTVDPETAARLPTAEAVAALYGRDPVVLGLESCPLFQAFGDPADHFVSTAGTFNTGTNLMAELLIANCVLPARQQKYGTRGVRWQVVWGKHTPVDDETFRQTHRTYTDGNVEANAMFPAVMVRDPFKWMQSMCRHPYGAQWVHDSGHCPNLVPNDFDYQLLAIDEKAAMLHDVTMNVTVAYAEFSRHHASLVEFWNDWYKAYAEAPFPRLIVRFEDVVFHPKQVTQTVCECAGGHLDPDRPFKFIVDSAKKGAAHGTEKTSYVDALVKYGTEEGRYKGFDVEDLEYAREHLDPDLMRLFGYRYPPVATAPLAE